MKNGNVSVPCSGCGGSGHRMVTVNMMGADHRPYQGVRMETCSGCNGSGQVQR